MAFRLLSISLSIEGRRNSSSSSSSSICSTGDNVCRIICATEKPDKSLEAESDSKHYEIPHSNSG